MPDNEISFVIAGQAQGAERGANAPSAARSASGTLKASVRLSAQRGSGETVRVTAQPGEDVVVLRIAGGPALVLHPETARDLMLSQGIAQRGAGVPDAVTVPAQLRWRGLEQAAPTRSAGFLGDVLLQAFDVVTGLATDDAADFVASKVVQKVDGKVDAGVYALNRDTLTALKGSAAKLDSVPSAGSAPLLVLVHGTFVDTVSTFGKLWTLHPQRVRQLFDHYAGRVYALDHPTLGASPIANALTLVRALPHGARLHLLTHSRGGLVAEVLARLAAQREIGAADLAFFDASEYATQRDELTQLAAEVRSRDIQVERVVRAACPARGTLLASKRLDAYLSVLKWSLELAGVPVAPEIVDFLTEVARRRADPALLPGLAAMIADTPLVNWLNGAVEPIAGELRVVAGDLQGDSVTGWIKTLLADAYYWTDNDIVVQTRSMYGGAPRRDGATFLLDQGGKVTHFNYFANDRTVDAAVAALTQPQPAGFQTIGPLSWAGTDSSGVRAALHAARGGDSVAPAAKPAVFVLPGILGSNLAAGGERIWLSARLIGGLDRLAYTGAADDVLPDGPIGLVYDKLIDHLSATHEVIPFAFDWRRPIEDEARRLADAVDAALTRRDASGQPVRLLAHSMGGLVARTMQLERPAVWERMMARSGARLLMLGTPNGGSWSPMQVLSGDDTFGNALAAFGSPLRDRAARRLMAAMPGLLQLQAGLLDQGLDSSAKWAQIAADDLERVRQHNWWHRYAGEATEAAYEWGVPPQAVLDQARALRERLDAQRSDALPGWADKVLLVVGHAKFTPDGYEVGADGLVYLDATDGGDGRVPLPLALLPGVRTWTLDCAHGDLPGAAAAFDAFDELLASGSTDRLPALSATRAAASPTVIHVPSRPSRARPNPRPPDDARAVFSSGRLVVESPDAPAGGALRVAVLNGNLSFIGEPLMVGHYRALLLTGTEKIVDRLIGGAMTASLSAGLYPAETGSTQIFANGYRTADNPWRAPRPQAVIVVGLGDEGKLRETDLSLTVRQGVIAWAQRIAETASGAPASFELATSLMGSGGVGIQASSSARAIAQGVRDANDRIAGKGWPIVSRLTLVELYLERASDAWHGLQVLATASPGHFAIEPTIASGIGPLRRQVDSGYRGTDYDFISATTGGDGTIAFTLDSRRARTEVRAQITQGKLVRELVQRASTSGNQDPQIGRTLFQLLVPMELEPFLGGTSRMVLELDTGTAPIPWELLDLPPERRAGGDSRPWAIRCQLLRKLRTPNFREAVHDADVDDNVLVIGEPLADPLIYPRLPGALAEAKAVAAALSDSAGVGRERLTPLVERDDATTIINALLARRYRIVHVAGHGEPGAGGGVVLSGGTFLGPRELCTMRTVPELVFVNCCHLAAHEPDKALQDFDRSQFAANVADALIGIGVRCVVAAGWAVDDGPASLFATTFYRALLRGDSFIAAVAAARDAAWQQGGNTWAAYQCYGDPNWTFRRSAEGGPVQSGADDDYAAVSSPFGLTLALEELIVQSRWMDADPPAQLERVRRLDARFAGLWGSIGAVAEAFAVAYSEARAPDAALDWYERALESNDASASMKAAEQFANLRARRAWQRVQDAGPAPKAYADARAELGQAVALLDGLSAMQPTIERQALLGSSLKRLAMVENRAGNESAEQRALQRSLAAYRAAEAMSVRVSSADLFYAALNRMAIELVIGLSDPNWPGFDTDATAVARSSLVQRSQVDPDFWSHAGLIEIRLYEAMAARQLAAAQPALVQAYFDLRLRVAAPSLWQTLADQAYFVLLPYALRSAGAERAAATALLQQLSGYGGYDAVPIDARAGDVQRYDAVVWHLPADAALARAAAKALRANGAAVWTSAETPRGHDRLPQLRYALDNARLCVVVLGKAPADETALREWSAIQEAAWRAPRVSLALLQAAKAPVPGFLRQAPRFGAQRDATLANAAAASLLRLLEGDA